VQLRRPTHPLYCTRNLKGNFRIGMRTEKSRMRRSLMSLQDRLRRIRHLSVREQVNILNAALRGHYAYYGIAGNFRSLQKVHRAAERYWHKMLCSRGTCSTRSNSGNRSCDQSCTFPIGSYKLSQCCESSSEERSAGNLHATFCGNRGRATASGDPVKSQQWLRYPTNPHAAFDVEGAGNVARHLPKPARQSSTLPMSGMWKRRHG
jgi:hypothetical protein